MNQEQAESNHELIKSIEELITNIPENKELDQKFQLLARRLKEQDKKLKKTIHDLNERNKEFFCLLELSRLAGKTEAIDDILESLVSILKNAMQYPLFTEVKIAFDSLCFLSDDYKVGGWVLSEGIIVENKKRGGIEIVYTKEMPQEDEGPFLKSERLLLRLVAERLGHIIERIHKKKELIKEKDFLQRIILTSPAGIVKVDTQGAVVFANYQAEKVLGLEKSSIESRKYNDVKWKITDEKGRPFPDEKLPFMQVMKTKKDVYNIEHSIEWADGTRKNLSINASPILDENDNFGGMVAAIDDITDKKKMQEEIEEIALFPEQNVNPVFRVSKEMVLLYANSAGFDLIDRDKIEIGDEIPTIWHETLREAWQANGKTEIEVKMHGKDYFFTRIPIHERGYINVYVLDITQRKEAERKLKSSEELFRIIFELAPNAYYINDLKGKFINGNKKAEQLIGYQREELIGKSFLNQKILPVNEIPKAANALAKNALGKPYGPVELSLRTKRGELKNIEIVTYPVEIKNQKLVLGIAHDITEKKYFQEKLASEREHFLVTLRSIGDGVITTNTHGKIVLMNHQAEKISGWKHKEVLGRFFSSVFQTIESRGQKKCLDPIEEILQSKRNKILEDQRFLITKNQDQKLIDFTVTAIRDNHKSVIGVVLVFRDISEKKSISN